MNILFGVNVNTAASKEREPAIIEHMILMKLYSAPNKRNSPTLNLLRARNELILSVFEG